MEKDVKKLFLNYNILYRVHRFPGNTFESNLHDLYCKKSFNERVVFSLSMDFFRIEQYKSLNYQRNFIYEYYLVYTLSHALAKLSEQS
jgi:lysozyme family protein